MTLSNRSKPQTYLPSLGPSRTQVATQPRSDIAHENLLVALEEGRLEPVKKKGRRIRRQKAAFGPTERHADRVASILAKLAARRKAARSKAVAATVAPAPEIPPEAFELGARARVILSGVRIAHEDLRAAGGAYSLEQVQELMNGVTRQAVEKRVNEGSLLAVPGPSNRRRYPAAQFNSDGSIVGGMRTVRESLPTTNPWTVLNFLVQPDPKLSGMKPIDLMRKGEIDLVVEAAKRVGEQGA